MAEKPKISAKIKDSRVERHNSLDLQTNSSKFHPRTTAARLCSLASSFNHRDNTNAKTHKHIKSKTHQSTKLDATQSIEERATQHTSITSYHQPPIHPRSSLQLDQDFINEEGNANEVGHEVDRIELDVDHVQSDLTDLRHGTYEIKKRTRGPTTGIGWSKRKYHCTKKVEVQIPTDLRRIVGERSQELITRSGRIVRLYAPLNVEKWAHIPVDIIDKIVDIIYRQVAHEEQQLPIYMRLWEKTKKENKISGRIKLQRSKKVVSMRLPYLEPTKLTESKSMQSMCQVYAAVSFICNIGNLLSISSMSLSSPPSYHNDGFYHQPACACMHIGILAAAAHAAANSSPFTIFYSPRFATSLFVNHIMILMALVASRTRFTSF
ncbi:Auxin response factor 16 [Platanthera guangdongensis]|uniref:Auxin response factor 16 n=1 Tax=Platanthera guangdongensis TaxID=2320717 RepID=A0ABR2MC52_9ASPA